MEDEIGPLRGNKVHDLRKLLDKRGFLAEVLKEDSSDLILDDKLQRLESTTQAE